MTRKLKPDEASLAQDRLARDSAHALFDHQLNQVKNDLSARGIGGRMLDTVTGQARDVIDQGIEVAQANKSVIAGTIAALALWFLRHPIIAQINRWRNAAD